jgi:hypothetical protein
MIAANPATQVLSIRPLPQIIVTVRDLPSMTYPRGRKPPPQQLLPGSAAIRSALCVLRLLA